VTSIGTWRIRGHFLPSNSLDGKWMQWRSCEQRPSLSSAKSLASLNPPDLRSSSQATPPISSHFAEQNASPDSTLVSSKLP